MNNIVFLIWAPYSTRSEVLSKVFKATLIKIHHLAFKNVIIAPFKYFLHFFHTIFVLFRIKPRIIFIMNPPIFCGLTGWIYCVLTRSRFILDSHTGAFIESKWRVFSFIHAFLARKALVNVVTNEYLCEYIKRWGGEHFVIPDPPIQFGALTKKSLNKPHVIIINTFSFDEPVKEILIAASKMPDVNFSMTGNLKYCKKEYLKLKPINFEFTGFMEKDDYISIIYSSDAALVLTKEDFTMQSGANEAMSIGIPIITSDWPVLRSIFYKGTVFVDNSVDGIMAGVKTALSNTMKLKQEINELRHERTILSQQIENLFRNEFLKGGQYTS